MMRIWLLVGLSWLWFGCEPPAHSVNFEPLVKPSLVYPTPDSTVRLSGEQLAYRYCQSCHAFPAPELLPKSVWTESVLPRMGHWLGIRGSAQEPYRGMSMYDDYIVRKAGIFPDTPQISEEGWAKLVAYYEQQAPDSLGLIQPQTDTILSQFRSHPVRLSTSTIPVTTLTYIDTISGSLWIGDARGMLYQISPGQTVTDSVLLDSPPSDIMIAPDGSQQVVTMGIMNPNDQIEGKLWQIEADKTLTKLLPKNFRRPVHFSTKDVNGDEKPDWLVAEFGNYLGQLAYYESTPDTTYLEYKIITEPGTRKMTFADMNQDGQPDLVALIAQGDERIVTWFNRGNNRYQPKELLRFPPVYGSSYFELADFNRDGRPDILYTNGDNADYSPVLKPYHGIRIFLQQADGSFDENYFYSMPGASKAVARDFDQDGDLDIAAISFFPDFEQTPERGFLYLENQSADTTLDFSVSTFSEAAHGHWLTMNAGDIDQDGDQDIILGSFTLPPSQASDKLKKYWATEGPHYMVLENMTE
jgi:hypothetical protein